MFNHLLVGIDFAQQPQVHYRFGLDLATHLGASLELVNIFHPSQMKGRHRSRKSIRELKAHFQQRMRQLEPAPQLEKKEFSSEISTIKTVLQGFPEEKLLYYSKTPETDLILLGVSGFSYPFNEEFGQVVVNVSQEAQCSVMLLPQDVRFSGFKRILLLSDMEVVCSALLEQVAGFAYLFASEIHFMNVIYDDTINSKESFGKEYEQTLQRIIPGLSSSFMLVSSEQLLPRVNAYLIAHDIELIYILSPNRYFWFDFVRQKLKSNYQLSKNIPILISHLDQ